jgi:RNA recognition motif. (a.k.a. RRM, RBD, or RNP domain)
MRICVGNLALTTSEEALRQLFAPYGMVERVQIMTDRETGVARLWLCRDAERHGGYRGAGGAAGDAVRGTDCNDQ